MKSISLTVSAVAMACAVPGLAQNDAVKQGPVPSWATESEKLPVPDDAQGLIFLRRSDILLHLDEQGESNFNSQTFRLLHPQALQAGNVSIEWNPQAGSPVVHRLLVHRDGETVDVLENAEFEILRREDQLEQAMLDGKLTAVLRVPDLRVGDDLEFAYTVPTHDPTLKDESFGALFVADAPPPGRFRLGLSWEEGQKPEVRIPDGLGGLVQRRENAIYFGGDDIPAATAPKDAPPRYSWHRVAQYSDFATWNEVSRRFAPMFGSASRLDADSPVRKEAARIAAKHSGDLARAQAALDLVQRQVRYIYVGLGGGNFLPASADETWQRRYGDCKGKTVLLLALLDEMGIAAEPVLANNAGTDDGLDERLPSPGSFDHILVRATIDGTQYWMDGTFPEVVGADVKPFMPYRWVLPLSGQGSDLEAVTHAPFTLPQEMGLYEIDARAGFDEPARKVTTMVTRGVDGIAQYAMFSPLTKNQLETAMRGEMIGGSEWDSIDSIDYRYDRATQASILKITGTGPVDWDDDGGGAYSYGLPGGGFSPPGRRQRAGDQDQSVPYFAKPTYSCHATTVRVPEGTDIENWRFNSTFDMMLYGRVYYRMMEVRDDGTVRMVRGARVDQPEITADHAARDNGRLADFDNSMANIYYNPKIARERDDDTTPVPATFEIDWTGPDAPCLPADLLGGG